MDTITHLDTDAEWKAAVGEARLRARFDASKRVKDARKAYKQAMVVARRMPAPGRGVLEKEAWMRAEVVYKAVNAELRAKLAACVDPETF